MAAAALLVLADAVPAAASPVDVVCASDVRLPPVVTGDLVVRDMCSASASSIAGDVRVEAGAAADLRAVDVGGDVLVAPRANVSLHAVDVAGGVRLDDAGYLGLHGSDVGRSVRGSMRDGWLLGTYVRGAVNLWAHEGTRPTRITFVGARTGGWVNLVRADVTIRSADLGRGLTLTGVPRGELCGLKVAADVTVQRSRGPVRVGGRTSGAGCEDARPAALMTFGAGLHLLDNRAAVLVQDVHVAGDAVCAGNAEPARVVGTVDGTRDPRCG
ncbi:hypothetical protein ACFUMH_11750 [Cellulomonas sp. NPDC057328]|uniref:hypothetical protein n=1 Tax=Cellulomonas sp. NPDC057328 TaxID=3346101 RepID=UPI0036404B88